MSVSSDPGPFVDAVISRLTTSLPAQIDTVEADAAYADTITVPDVAAWFRARLGQYDTYPCQVVVPEGVQGGGGAGPYMSDGVHNIAIVTYQISNLADGTLLPGEVMEKQLERIVRATREVLDANRTLTITGIPQAYISLIRPPEWLDFEFSPGDPAQLRRSARFTIEAIGH